MTYENNQHETDQMIELSCGSLIQHGTYNDRIYFMKPGDNVNDSLPHELIDMAKQKQYSKIFAKVPEDMVNTFIRAEYELEAQIPGLYNATAKGCFMGFYTDDMRSVEKNAQDFDDIRRLAESRAGTPVNPLDKNMFTLRQCVPADAGRMAEIYAKVFHSYPFPIQDPEYLLETMRSHVDYFGVEHNGELIALSSAEMDNASSSVEMTDFATLPDFRGYGLAAHLLTLMEEAMRKKHILTAYTIARAASPGMNITFARLNYAFGGRLKNNTNISGSIESMNVWYKAL
ncbi:MAG: putative beta-lysine N-acetyltransferase [Victivallales bacterium]|nr:putative beta-lysine N-acetyltransferase [Victivallales bacterium]